MKRITSSLLALCTLFGSTLYAQVPVKPAHVIFVLEENYARTEIIGSAYAPTLTALSKDSTTVNFTKAYAISHPSEPNYLDLFSGSNQGVTTDLVGPAPGAPFNDCNLGSSLIANGYTFIGYSEDQPSGGWTAGDVGNYVTKHCPWINWMNGDNGINGTKDTVPVNSDVPMFPIGTYFPDSLHYNNLPTVSWVIPNQVDDMHNPYTPATAISNGDKWFKANMMPLVRWAANPINNALVIVIWDEDDGTQSNNIPLLFCGGIVKGGTCTTKLTHYDILKTVEDMYGLSLCGSSAAGIDVPASVWLVTGINSINGLKNSVSTWPVPAKEQLNVAVTSVSEEKANIALFDITGRMVKQMNTELKAGENNFNFSTADITNGVYFLNIVGEKINVCKKIFVQK